MGDWFLDYVLQLTRNMAGLVMDKELPRHELFDAENHYTTGERLLGFLQEKLAAHDINGAENLLFECIEADPRAEYYPFALQFYEALDALDDATLAENKFSRDEIEQGRRDLEKIYAGQAPPH